MAMFIMEVWHSLSLPPTTTSQETLVVNFTFPESRPTEGERFLLEILNKPYTTFIVMVYVGLRNAYTLTFLIGGAQQRSNTKLEYIPPGSYPTF